MATIAHPPETDEEVLSERPSRVVWALAWPAVALNSLQVVNTLLDRGFIGHLPSSALTAHGGATNVMFLMFSLAMALATGVTALVSRAFGADDPQEYRRAAQESLGLAMVGGFLLGGVTVGIAGYAARFVLPASDTEAQAQMTKFLIAYGCGLPPIFVIQALAGSLRGIGDTKSPMVISGIQILLHMTLNFLFIFGLGFGLVGAATALSVSAWVAALGYVAYIGRTPLGRLRVLAIPGWAWVVRIMRIAIPAAVMATLRVLSLTGLTLVLKQVANASEAIAAMTIGFAIESVMFMPAFGLSVAAGALVGQSLGMKKPERAERLAWIAAHHGALVTLALITPIFLGAHTIAHVLVGGDGTGDKGQIVLIAAQLLRYLCVTEVLFAYAMVMMGAMQGAGDTVRPLWISIGSLWGLRMPLVVYFALPAGFHLGIGVSLPYGLGLGATGAWIAMASTQGIQGVLSIFAFRRGAWKTKRV